MNMIDKAVQIDRSLRCLQSMALRLAPRRLVVQRPGESMEDAKDKSGLDYAMTGIFLYAMIVELTIKGLWSYENNGVEPERTHHIVNIFGDLRPETKTRIKALYESICKDYVEAISKGKQQLGKEGIQVEMASLDEAFEWNANAMVHLKYDLIPHGKTVPTVAMWDSKTIWTFPGDTIPNFGSQLLSWAENYVKKSVR